MKTFIGAVTPLIIAGQLFFFSTSVNAQPGPVAHWSFDSSSGSTYYDVTGHGYDAVGTGTGLGLATGVKGQALSCSGSAYEIYAANTISGFYVPRFTIECWFYCNVDPSALPENSQIVTYQYIQSGVRNGYSFVVSPSGNIMAYLCSASGSSWIIASSSDIISGRTWYHLTCTYDSAALKIYINGALSASAAYAGTYLPCPIDARIGCIRRMDTPNPVCFINGRLDELKFYNYALTADSIISHYSGTSIVPVLIAYTPNPTYVRRPQLRWYHHDSISTYRIEIDTNRLFTSPLVSVPRTDTFYLPTSDLPYDTIYWRVRNEAYPLSWSTISSVRIIHALPTLIAFTPNPTGNRRPQLRWYSHSAISTYRIEIDTVQLFTAPIISSAVTDTFYLPASDLPYDTIYWRVRNDADMLSWSAVSSLVIVHIYPAGVVVAHWSFDSSSGSTYYDVTGHGYDAIASGTGVGLASGVKGQALSCPGSGYEIYAANSRNDFFVSKFTIETWFYSDLSPSQFTGEMKILDYQYVQSGVRNGYTLYLNNAGYVVSSMSNSTGSTWYAVQSSGAINGKTWYHLACTYDSSLLRIYIDGAFAGSVAYQGTYVKPPNDARIGCARRADNSNAVMFVDGMLDELKFYNYALPADSISAHNNALRPVLIAYTPNPTYNWRPLLRWYDNPAIALFRIQIATDTLFSSLLASVPAADTFYLPTIDMPLDTIFWRVANEVSTGVDLWSARSSLIVKDSSVPVLIPYTPDPTYVRRPQLTWHPGKGATSYTIQINTAPAFTTPLVSDSASDTTYTPAADLPLGAIYWRVMSKGGRQYSLPDTFLVLSDSVPVLIPITPDTQRTFRPRFTWYHTLSATSYLFQIDLAGNFASPYFSTTLTDTTYPMTTDLPSGKLFWRVGAIYAASTVYSTADTFWVFVTGVAPKASGASRQLTSASFTQLRHGVTINYHLEKQGTVSLDIYTFAGNRIAATGARDANAGDHTILWNGTDHRGRALPPGSYCAVLRLNGQTFTKKIALVW